MIKHISLGTKEVFYFDYDGEQLPLRPISSFELDESFNNALLNAEDEIAELVVKIKLSLVDLKSKIDIDNKKFANLKKFYELVDYWIVFFAMKDFQDEDFTKPDGIFPSGFNNILKMKHVHDIAKKILNFSYQPKEVIQEIVKNEEGKIIASIVFNLNVPLAEYSKLTKLQRDFLILSKFSTKTEHVISKTGDKADLRDILKGVI